MRIIAVVDSTGNISTLMTYAANAARPGMAVPPGSQAVELDVSDLSAKLDGPALAGKLRELREKHRLDVSAKKLIRKG